MAEVVAITEDVPAPTYKFTKVLFLSKVWDDTNAVYNHPAVQKLYEKYQDLRITAIFNLGKE